MDAIFTVVNRSNGEQYKVYDISYDSNGYPHFLIYRDGEWIRKSAKYFRPFTYEDMPFMPFIYKDGTI